MTALRAALAALCFLTAIFPFSAQAAKISSEYLENVCRTDEKGKEYVPGGNIACQAYIAGVVDYHTLLRSLGTAPSIDFCVPESVDLVTLQKVYVAYMIRHRSEHQGFIAAPAVALALYEAFPCKGK